MNWGEPLLNNASESLHFQYKLPIEQNRNDETLAGKPVLKSTISQATDEYVEMCQKVRRETFTPKGKREFVPHDQAFPALIVLYLVITSTQKYVVSRQFYP